VSPPITALRFELDRIITITFADLMLEGESYV